MRVAIIDLGTNSVRFDVHQFGPGKAVRTLHREKIMVRLGQGVFTNGQLDPDAIHRTAHAFANFKKLIRELSVTRTVALGTSALREAVDSGKLVSSIRARTGIDVRVISGQEEARLIALGILANERFGGDRIGLIDIGGGSTEISVCQGRKILRAESFQLGTARLQQVFLKRSPPAPESVEQLRRYVHHAIATQMHEERWPKPQALYGSSGTIKALAKIVKKHGGGKALKLKDLSALVKRMTRMTTTQLLGLPGMEAKRVDMILAGAILLEESMLALKADKISTTDYSLRDGILQEQVNVAVKHHSSSIAFHADDLYEKARRFGGSERNLRAVADLAGTLFKKLAPLHKLDPDDRLYLDAAAILRNTGESISIIGHQEHSYYIVKNAKFPFIDEEEAELVAQLCRHHELHKLDAKNLPFEKGVRRAKFLKLLALLCVADALDAEPKSPVTLKRLKITRRTVEVTIGGGSKTDLEVFRAQQRKHVFQAAFRRELVVRRS